MLILLDKLDFVYTLTSLWAGFINLKSFYVGVDFLDIFVIF